MFWAIGVMMTNAYVMYVSINTFIYGFNRKQLMSHHDFRRAIVIAWINPREREKDIRERATNIPIIRKRKSTATTVSSLTEEDTVYEDEGKINENVWDVIPERRHAKHVNDESLEENGNLSGRLDCTLNHLPCPANIRARCALHKWVGVETKAQVSYCSSCAVHLCILCYRMFHQCKNIVCQKAAIKKKYKKPTQNKKKKKPKKKPAKKRKKK